MKINGPNKSNFNPYQEQVQKNERQKASIHKEDQLEISSKAKELQKNKQPNKSREKYVKHIKEEVQSGTYQVNHEKTAKKMIEYWSKL